jgi:hypothetical protein
MHMCVRGIDFAIGFWNCSDSVCNIFCFSFYLLVVCLVYLMLTVSLDCLRLVSCVPNVDSVSGLSSSCVLYT